MQFDEAMADNCRAELRSLLVRFPLMQNTWTASGDGQRRFMSYKCADMNKDGVDWPGLDKQVDVLRRLLTNAPALCEQELHELTAEVAVRGAIDDLKMVAQELGEDMTDEELKEMIAGANKGDREGTVNQSGFFNILNKSNT